MQPEVKEQVATIQPDPKEEKIRELEKKLGEKDSEYKKMEDYVKQADEVSRVIQSDPQIVESLKRQYAKMYGVVPAGEESSKQQEEKPEKKDVAGVEDKQIRSISEEVKKVSRNQREQLIKDFEDRAGISGLTEDEKSQVRKDLESHMNKWGSSVRDAPLDTLGGLLEDSYKFINYDKVVREGTIENLAKTFNNASGAMGGLVGRQMPAQEEDTKLNDKQRMWADKFGLKVEQVEKVGKDLGYDEKHKHPSEVEK